MSLLQLSRSPDLLQLRNEGYNLEIRGGYLLVRDIPYVNSAKQVCRGILVMALDLAGDRTAVPTDHTAMFCGDMPCHADGTPMDEIKHQSIATEIVKGLIARHGFSRKPPRGHYTDYYEKVQTYVSLLAREATVIEPLVTGLTAQVVEPEEEGYPFNYLDTASSRADINAISNKLVDERVAIVGLGGTGSYVLDLVAKTPVKEVHLFDADKLLTHNAFRAPGAPSVEELREQPRKASYFESRYAKMKRGIKAHEEDIDASNVDVLRATTFVPLRSVASVQRIVRQIARGEPYVTDFSVNDPFRYWYSRLKWVCGVARTFLREEYAIDPSAKPQLLWSKYVHQVYWRRNRLPDAERTHAIASFLEWAETTL